MPQRMNVKFKRTRLGYIYEILKAEADEHGRVDISKIDLPNMTDKQKAADLRGLSHFGLYRAGGYVLG